MRGLWRHQFRQTTLQLILFLSLLAGIGLAKLYQELPTAPVWLSIVLIGISTNHPRMIHIVDALSQSKDKKRLRGRCGWFLIIFIVVAGVSLGYWRGAAYATKLSDYQPLYYHKVTLRAVAGEDATYGKTKQLGFLAGDVRSENGSRLTGKILLSGFGVNAVFQADEVTASGKLYPGSGAYQARISFAAISVTAHHPTIIADWRRKFVAGMQSVLPEPLAPFAMGLLVGQRATLPEGVKQDLLMVGLTHIIAVSGYNLTIILHASRRLLGKLSKRLATGMSLGLIVVFLAIAGASASIVRAAIVSVLSIWAAYYGRPIKPLNLLALTAVITGWANPNYLWGDLSWYLSFLAFFGVMILAPLIQGRWPGEWHKSLLGGVALESVCAEAMSLPFVLHIFGQMSLIGLPANVLVVTLVPLAMLLSLVAGLGGMLCGSVGGWLAWPAAQLLNYMLDIAHIMAHIPGVFIQNRSLSLAGMLGLYGLILLLTTALWGDYTLRAS